MNVLFIASEGSPFIKTGGLGDVVGSLPKALKRQKINTAVILPNYQTIPEKYKKRMVLVKEIIIPLSWRNQYCGIKKTVYNKITYYFIDNEYYFKRNETYGHSDDAERYAFFSRAVLEALPYLDFKPDILHCNDWQTGLVSVYLHALYQDKEFYKNIKTIFTIHNMIYQGVFSKKVLEDVIGLGYEYFTYNGMEFYDQINFLKAGLVFSDIITTVSNTYAQEIQTSDFGEGLEGIIKERSAKLYGIVNGIDYEEYKPSASKDKAKNKQKLQRELGLEENKEIPMLAIVSRLVTQKGFDLIKKVLDEMLSLELQLVVLGTGEEKIENMFKEAVEKFPLRVSANITFDESLARKIYAAADMFLMPSYFEPCGISQLIALRYSCIPIVRETGGLKDTIIPFDKLTGEGNGLSFKNYNAQDMLYTIKNALELYQDKNAWSRIMKNAAKSDYSWNISSKEYSALYNSLHLR